MFDHMIWRNAKQGRKTIMERQSAQIARRRKRACRDINGLTDLDEINKYFAGILDGNIDSLQDNILNGPLDPDSDGDGAMDGLDMDPLVDLKVTVKVLEILQLDDVDTNGDFYVRVKINNQWFPSDLAPSGTKDPKTDSVDQTQWTGWDNDNHKMPDEILEKFTFTGDVPDDVENVIIQIELFDDDYSDLPLDDDTDDRCDISGRATSGDAGTKPEDPESGRACQVTYNLKNGQWIGDDNVRDANGYGHVRGDETPDGSTGISETTDHEDDCELWFDITQNDYDADGLTWWQECGPGNSEAYETDPTDPDTDGDGLLDGWEVNAFKNPLNPKDTYEVELNIHFLDFEPTVDYMLDYGQALGLVSKKLYDATDGYAYIKHVNFHLGYASFLGTPSENQIYVSPSLLTEVYWAGNPIQQKWMNMISNPISLENGPESWTLLKWNQIFMHELGHLLFILPDEYKYPDDCACIMDPMYENEFCNDNSCTQPTYLESGGSCWERFFNNINSNTGLLYHRLIDFDLNHDGIIDTNYYHTYNGLNGPYDSVDELITFTINW